MDNVVTDKRSEVYHFNSLLELFENFSTCLSTIEMDLVVRESAQNFVSRQLESKERTRLQFVKKCEFGMRTLIKLKGEELFPRLKSVKISAY